MRHGAVFVAVKTARVSIERITPFGKP